MVWLYVFLLDFLIPFYVTQICSALLNGAVLTKHCN
jgi:hypothetical protein